MSAPADLATALLECSQSMDRLALALVGVTERGEPSDFTKEAVRYLAGELHGLRGAVVDGVIALQGRPAGVQ